MMETALALENYCDLVKQVKWLLDTMFNNEQMLQEEKEVAGEKARKLILFVTNNPSYVHPIFSLI